MNDFTKPQEVFQLLRDLPCCWGVAGGWAVDLFLDVVTRHHQDIEIAMFRDDQLVLQGYLSSRGWSFDQVVHGHFHPWHTSERLVPPVHEVWGRCDSGELQRLEVLLNERSTEDFVFRRDARIKLPIGSAFLRSKNGIPILAPEIVLLYKSKRPVEGKEQSDFSRILPALGAERRQWLSESISVLDPGHPWLASLKVPR